MTITKIPVRTVFDNSNNPIGLAEFQVGEVIAIAQGGTSANTVAQAKINLEVDNNNVRSLFSVSGGGSYDNTTGVITIDATDLTPFAKTVDLTTANVAELTNLYFTNARAFANLTSASTSSLQEGTNLYYTNARVFSAVTGNLALKANIVDLTTANVVEVTSLYFTTERSRASISASGSISYDNSTGIISFTQGNTDSVLEGVTNLYFTNARTDARVSPAFNQANTATTIAEAAFNSSNTKTVAADLTTANVAELTNLYFTNARAVAALTGQSVSIGEATITGNLFVLGNVVEFNTETIVIEDKNIVLANGSPDSATSNGAGITVDGSNATLLYLSDGDKWEFNKDLSVSGDIAATGNITSPFFYSESDIALKEDVNPISNALKKVLKLTGVDFIWKKTNQKGLGVIAQEVEKIIPHIVSTSRTGYKTVQYDSLVPLLIEAIKDQQKQIDELRKKIK